MEYKIYKGSFQSLNEQDYSKEMKDKYKLIYLDPPYNTLRERGARKDYGDKEASEKWETLITACAKNAYEYLRDDGFVAISINQTELFNIKNIFDNVFGKELFIGLFPVKIRHSERQLMINATFHDVYEYLLFYRKTKATRFNGMESQRDISHFCYEVIVNEPKGKKTIINGKEVTIYEKGDYEIKKGSPSKDSLRRYIIAGKLKTANWSGEWYETNLSTLGQDKLIKVNDLEHDGLGYRWFQTSSGRRKSGVYFQSYHAKKKTKMYSNEIDLTDEVTQIYREGGDGCDYKDSKKPEKLISQILEMCTNEGDHVLDMFGGSGTTLAVAIKNNRNCMIIERNDKACEIIINRLENMKAGVDLEDTKYKFNYEIIED